MGDRRRAGGGLAASLAAVAVAGLIGFVIVAACLSVGLSAQAATCVASPSAGAGAGAGAPAGISAGAPPGIPAGFLVFYVGAAQQFDLGPAGWAYLAAINAVESNFDDTSLPGVASGANAFGAAGPMQIGIGGAAGDTWSRIAVAGVPGGANPPSVYDEADAVYAAANLLRTSGAPGDWTTALLSYNHAGWYVSEVAGLAARYALSPLLAAGGDCGTAPAPAIAGGAPAILPDGQAAVPESAPAPVQEMLTAGNRIVDQLYSYGGGHAPASMGVPPEPGADPGAEENGGPGYDCSSAVDYVLWGAGLGISLLGGAVPASEALSTVGEPGPGRWVTIYAGASGGQPHAFIAVDGVVLDTVHLEPTAPAGTGPRWQPAAEVERELSSGDFVARHPPGL